MANKKVSISSENQSCNWQKEKILKAREHQDIAFDAINNLSFRERNGRKIILPEGQELIEFVSCSYLGLDSDERVIAACSNNLSKYGVTFPAARTRIKAENFSVLEELLNNIFCNAFTVTFSSLHLAHLGLIPLISSGEMPSYPVAKNGIIFILDKSVHASIQINRALMLQFGEVKIADFASENIEELFKKARAKKQTPIAIADSIGSMGGINDVSLLLRLAEKYDGYVYLDDAHGTSIFGKHGCGYVLKVLEANFHPRLILAASLAKAFGSIAGVIVLPTIADARMVKEFASTYIFSGPLGMPIINAAIASARIHLTEEITFLQKKLQENLEYFDSFFLDYQDRIVNYSNVSPIRGIKTGEEMETIEYTYKLREQGIAVTAAMYPTVAKGAGMLRLSFSAVHTKDEIADLCHNLRNIIFCRKDIL